LLNPTEGPCAALQSCAASEVPSVRSSFDEQDQLDKVEVVLLEGETVIAGYDGGDTGFIGLTDRRVILQDNEFDGSRSALTSVPYRRIDAVSFVSDTSESGGPSEIVDPDLTRRLRSRIERR
jgi:hypothetical protein